jgi:hypothetical protein
VDAYVLDILEKELSRKMISLKHAKVSVGAALPDLRFDRN